MEWNSGGVLPTEVPISYLWKLIFLHEESSDLAIYNRRQRLGSLHLQPHRQVANPPAEGEDVRRITAIGGFSLDLPGTSRQNVVVHGSLELDAHDAVRMLELSAVVHEPRPPTSGWTLVLDGHPDTGQWHYSIRQGDDVLREQTGTMSQLLAIPELRSLGIDPAGFAAAQQQQMTRMTVTAHRDKLRVNGDEIDTYVVDLKDANGFDCAIYLNQLGQILAVKSFTGIELLDNALTP